MRSIIIGIIKMYYRLFFRPRISGEENIPMDQAVLVAPNHLSNHDPIVLGAFYPRNLFFLAKKELFEKPLSAKFFTYMNAYPVNRDGNDINAIKKSLQVLKHKEHLLIFPEGTRNEKDFPLPGKPGVPMIAYKSKTKILPVSIYSSYKPFSKIFIKYHPVVEMVLSEGEKPSVKDYEEFSNKLLSMIYDGRIKE